MKYLITNQNFILLFIFFSIAAISSAQVKVEGTYTKSIQDQASIIEQIGSPYRYSGCTKHKLILKKDSTFRYIIKHQAEECRIHQKRGKVLNYKVNRKVIYLGIWKTNQDTLLLKEKQIGVLYFLFDQSKKTICLCEKNEACVILVESEEFGYPHVFRRKKKRKEIRS